MPWTRAWTILRPTPKIGLGERSPKRCVAERSIELSRALAKLLECACRKRSIDDRLGNVDKAEVAAAGVAAQPGERLLHVEVGPFSEHSLRLLDDDAGVQGLAELVVEHLGLDRGTMLQDGDGGDVGEGLGRDDVGLLEPAALGAEEIESADRQSSQPHG